MFDVGGPVERSLCRRGQFLVVVGALLGALIGVVLGLAVEDSQTPTAVAAPGGHVARRWPPIRRAASPPHPRRLVAGIEPMAMGPPTASALSRRTDPTTGMATPATTAKAARTNPVMPSPARPSPARVNTARARTSRPQPAAPPTQRARVGAAARRFGCPMLGRVAVSVRAVTGPRVPASASWPPSGRRPLVRAGRPDSPAGWS